MHLFECVLKCGHVGSGKSAEKSVRIRANNIMQAMRRAKTLPGVKKGALLHSGGSVMRISMIY